MYVVAVLVFLLFSTVVIVEFVHYNSSTCNFFPLGNWAHMNPDPTENDHNLIESLLTHNFLCRLRPENVECLKNPTVAEFRTALKALKKRVQQDGFLVVYLSTHIIRIASSGAKVPIQKSKKKEDTYIALHDSMWVSACCFCVYVCIYVCMYDQVTDFAECVLYCTVLYCM